MKITDKETGYEYDSAEDFISDIINDAIGEVAFEPYRDRSDIIIADSDFNKLEDLITKRIINSGLIK